MHCPPPSLSLPQLNNDWYQGDEEEEVGKREGEEALITLPPPSLRKPCTDVSPAHVETTAMLIKYADDILGGKTC